MATQQNAQTVTIPAGSDLSAKQYYFMDVVSGKLSVAGDGTRVAGVLTNDPDAADKPGTLQYGGIAKVIAGGSITSGAGVASSSTGTAVAAAGSDFVCGISTSAGTISSGEIVEVLLTGASAVGLAGETETVTSGALNPDIAESYLSVTSTVAFTLADGTRIGQRKRIEVTVAATSPAGTLTINDAYASQPTAWVFTEVGQMIEIEWTATGWRLLTLRAAGIDAPAGATTLNMLVYLHNVTIADTLDWILPSGVVPGQMQSIKVAATSGSPAGTISGLFYTTAGAATGVDVVINAASDAALLVWNGARWVPEVLTSATIA